MLLEGIQPIGASGALNPGLLHLEQGVLAVVINIVTLGAQRPSAEWTTAGVQLQEFHQLYSVNSLPLDTFSPDPVGEEATLDPNILVSPDLLTILDDDEPVLPLSLSTSQSTLANQDARLEAELLRAFRLRAVAEDGDHTTEPPPNVIAGPRTPRIRQASHEEGDGAVS